MKTLIKYTAALLLIGSAAGTAQANSATYNSAAQANCMSACPAAYVKSTRRIVRIEAVPTKKIQPSAAYNGKYLAKLNTKDQAYGKVLMPTQQTSRTPNVYRP